MHRVAIAFSTDSHEQTLAVIRSMQDSDVQIDIVPRMFEVLGTNAQLHTIEGIPLVGLPIPQLSGSERFLKRSFDVLGAAAGLVLLSPLLLIASISIAIDSRGPIFFRQVRMGAQGRTFHVLKFRTMVHDAESRKADVAHMNMHRDEDPRMFKIPDDPRVTRVGGFLRRWRIDELPQLINVIRGEMSIVGPRPLILDEDQHVEAWARKTPRSEAGHDRLVAGAGSERHPVRRDDEARLPVRDELVAARGRAPDHAHPARARPHSLRVLSVEPFATRLVEQRRTSASVLNSGERSDRYVGANETAIDWRATS